MKIKFSVLIPSREKNLINFAEVYVVSLTIHKVVVVKKFQKASFDGQRLKTFRPIRSTNLMREIFC